ncbi:MAG: VanZ family protein [Gammaproteobacteria bacterium]
MKLSHTYIISFRVLLCITLAIVTYLATTTLEFTVVSSIHDKINHFVSFFVLALLLDFSFPNFNFNRFKIILLITYGFSLEMIQHFLPHRMFSLLDVVADIVGLAGYGLLIPLIKNIPILDRRWS